MTDSLDIAQVAKLTGLTARALRFYEARGLIRPLRAASGRRHYGPAELERLHQILALKRAGLSLAQIQRIAAGRTLDLRALVAAQIDALDAQAREIDAARALLATILSRIDRSEPIDVATFCSLIRQGELTMTQEKWADVRARYMTPEQVDATKDLRSKLPPDFDGKAHNAKWKDLCARIKAALPMDPASAPAQAFLDESQELARPFIELSSAAAREGLTNLYRHFDEWQGEIETGLDPDAFHFLRAAGSARGRLKWTEAERRHMTPEQFAAVEASRRAMPADFDRAAHEAKWAGLLARVKSALPMDPAGPQAQAFLDEWEALSRITLDAASPLAQEGLRNFSRRFEEWHEALGPGFDVAPFRFHREAMQAREAMKK